MSNGLQLFRGEDGSQIIFDPNTGKRYALLEKEIPFGVTHYPQQQQYYDGCHNTNYIRPQYIHQDNSAESHQQVNIVNENQAYPPNLMMVSLNRILTSHVTTSHQNIQTRIASQCGAQYDNTSTPSQPRTEQERINVTETHEGLFNTTMNNNKRALNDSDEFITIQSRNQKKRDQKTGEFQQTTNKQIENSRASPRNKISRTDYGLPFEQLQHAVAHNLPCFAINFTDNENLPPAVVAAEELYEHFINQEIKLNYEFSVVRYFGKASIYLSTINT